MKTKSNSHHIDLRDVVLIGPLSNSRNELGGGSGMALGCHIYFRHREGVWLSMTDDKIDPYQLDDAKNALARATANQNYNLLVEQWKAAD